MKIEHIIEAWKNEEAIGSAKVDEAGEQLAHPAGELHQLSPEELAEVGGGVTITTSSWICGVAVTVTVCDELVDFFNTLEPGEPGNKTLYCFAAETPVLTPQGHRPIHAFQAGDMVLALDSDAGAVREARVEGLDVHRGSFPVLDLRSGDERVEVTTGHLFHDRDRWRPVETLHGRRAMDLRERARPITFRGARQTSAVYNLRVEGLSSYCVGQANLLVRDH